MPDVSLTYSSPSSLVRMLEEVDESEAAGEVTPLDCAHLSRETIFCLFLDPNSAVSEKVDVVLARKAVDGALVVNANADVAERSAREIESFMVILILLVLYEMR